MKHQNLPTLLEAAAITVCLILFAGQPGKARTLTSQTTIKTFHESLNESITLVVGQNPTGLMWESSMALILAQMALLDSNVADISKDCGPTVGQR